MASLILRCKSHPVNIKPYLNLLKFTPIYSFSSSVFFKDYIPVRKLPSSSAPNDFRSTSFDWGKLLQDVEQKPNVMAQSQKKGKEATRWTTDEDHALVKAMQDLLDLGELEEANGKFKDAAYAKIESLMEKKNPGCGKKAHHIASRFEFLHKKFNAINEMLSPEASGFVWYDLGKCVTCDKSVWDAWLKTHKNATGLRNKPFPLYDELKYFFGKDRATLKKGDTLKREMEDKERSEQEKPVIPFNTEGISSTSQTSQAEPSPTSAPSSTETERERTETMEVLKQLSSKLDKIADDMLDVRERMRMLTSS